MLRPKMSPTLRTAPPAPRLQLIADIYPSEDFLDLQARRLQTRIDTLELSMQQLFAEKEALQSKLIVAEHTISGMHSMLNPSPAVNPDYSCFITLNDGEYAGTYWLGFDVDEFGRKPNELILNQIYPIGAMDISNILHNGDNGLIKILEEQGIKKIDLGGFDNFPEEDRLGKGL